MPEIIDTKKELSDLLQLVSFKIDEEEFGVDILKVQEIIKIISITKVPNSPYFVEGIINLRGKVIPIIDLRKRLGLERIAHTNDTRIIVVELENKIVGFIVDAVYEVLRISRSITEVPPELVTGINSEYITAVGKLDDRILILLDLEKILSINEKKQLESN